jgi:hypothetical protein
MEYCHHAQGWQVVDLWLELDGGGLEIWCGSVGGERVQVRHCLGAHAIESFDSSGSAKRLPGCSPWNRDGKGRAPNCRVTHQ